MIYYLYTFSDNWADEMDLEGFAILTETQKDAAVANIRRRFKRGGTLSFGTNEDNEYDSLEDVMNCIDFKQISHQEYETIKKVFGSISMGETGPLNTYNLDEDEDDMEEDEMIETCDNCGCELDDGDDSLCEDCKEEEEEEAQEQEYDANARKIYDFIKKEYGLEETPEGGFHSRFVWKPTPKTQIEITIGEFDDGEEEVELTLSLGSKELQYEFFYVDDVYSNPSYHLKDVVKQMIEKAKKY